MGQRACVLCVSESVLDAEHGIDNVNTLLARSDARCDTLLYAGAAEGEELVQEALKVRPGRTVHLGANLEELTPLWFWGVAVCVRDGLDPSESVVICADGWRVATVHDDPDLSLAFGLYNSWWRWSVDRGCSGGGLKGLFELSSVANRVNSPAVIEAMWHGFVVYLRRFAALGQASVEEPLPRAWRAIYNGLAFEYTVTQVSPDTVARAFDAARSFAARTKRTRQDVQPPLLTPCERLCRETNDLGAPGGREQFAERMRDLSALCYVRGELLQVYGLYSLAFMAYWRAVDIYAHFAAFERGVLELGRDRRWFWKRGVGETGEVTSRKVFDALATDGAPLIPVKMTNGQRAVKEIRIIRNKCLMAHGVYSPGEEAVNHAAELVKDAIEAWERPGSKWWATVRALRRCEPAENVATTLLAVVLDESI